MSDARRDEILATLTQGQRDAVSAFMDAFRYDSEGMIQDDPDTSLNNLIAKWRQDPGDLR